VVEDAAHPLLSGEPRGAAVLSSRIVAEGDARLTRKKRTLSNVTTLHLDTETFCATPIKHGAYRYAEDAKVLLVPFAFDDDPVTVWDLTDTTKGDWRWKCELQDMIDRADRVVIHNSMFDRVVLAAQGVHIPVEKIDDTMVVALMHSLPAGLGQLGEVLGVPHDKAKDKEGKKLIQLFCSPCPKNWKISRATRETHPEEWQRFIEYGRLDVVAMRDVRARLPRWNDTRAERALWHLDQRTNDRGVAVDSDLARSALRAFERASRSLAARCSDLTGGRVTSATQRQKLLDYLREGEDFEIADLTKGAVDAALQGDMPDTVRELLEIRRQASATSPAKYGVLLDAACADGRLRGLLQFCGASRPGRDAGRIFQPQNLPRPSMSNAQVEAGIAAMKADAEDLLFDNVSELCANAVRGALVAEDGKKLVIADLSNIEGRVAAWLANEEWKLQAFRDYDAGTGHDLYVLAYARSFGLSPEAVIENKKTGDGMMRQIGKVMELALGFGGGAGAFATMAANYGVDLPDSEVDDIVKAWRSAHPRIKRFWYDLEDCLRWAIRRPGTTHEVGLIRVSCNGDGWLRVRGPSGRYLSYPDAQIDEDGRVSYMGVDQYTKQWKRIETYGGKCFENLVQFTARDVFMHGYRLAEAKGYAVVLRVHDELVCEVPDTDAFTATELSALMSTNPSWAIGLPLAAAGHETYRYCKE
jgi:DNA polymerase